MCGGRLHSRHRVRVMVLSLHLYQYQYVLEMTVEFLAVFAPTVDDWCLVLSLNPVAAVPLLLTLGTAQR